MSRSLPLALLLASAFSAVASAAPDVTIEINRDDQYIETAPNSPGKQYNVVVFVGQKVQWQNRDNARHTATSDLRVSDGDGERKFLFDTGRISGGADSGEIEFTQDMYDKAKAALGLEADEVVVPIGYFCAEHPGQMGGKIAFVPSQEIARQMSRGMKDHAAEPESKQ